MKLTAALKLASLVKNPIPEKIIPSVFEEGLAEEVAKAVVETGSRPSNDSGSSKIIRQPSLF